MYTREELQGEPKYRLRPIAKQLDVPPEKCAANASAEEMIDAIMEAQEASGEAAEEEPKAASGRGARRAAAGVRGKSNGKAAAEKPAARRGGRGRAAAAKAEEKAPEEEKPATRRGGRGRASAAKAEEEAPSNGKAAKAFDVDEILSPIVERLEAIQEKLEAVGTVVEGNKEDGNIFEACMDARDEIIQSRYDSRYILDMILFLGEALEEQDMLEKGATKERLAEVEKEYGPQE